MTYFLEEFYKGKLRPPVLRGKQISFYRLITRAMKTACQCTMINFSFGDVIAFAIRSNLGRHAREWAYLLQATYASILYRNLYKRRFVLPMIKKLESIPNWGSKESFSVAECGHSNLAAVYCFHCEHCCFIIIPKM